MFIKKAVFISIGGFFGAIARYVLSQSGLNGGSFPYGTLIINVLGCFIIGVLMSLAPKKYTLDKDLTLGASAGFCGAFTTFSTMCKEIVLISEHSVLLASGYIVVSIILGMLAVSLGLRVLKPYN